MLLALMKCCSLRALQWKLVNEPQVCVTLGPMDFALRDLFQSTISPTARSATINLKRITDYADENVAKANVEVCTGMWHTLNTNFITCYQKNQVVSLDATLWQLDMTPNAKYNSNDNLLICQRVRLSPSHQPATSLFCTPVG